MCFGAAHANQLGQKNARSTKPGRKQHGQYKTPSTQPVLVEACSCHAPGVETEVDAEEELVYSSELPDSALGPLR